MQTLLTDNVFNKPQGLEEQIRVDINTMLQHGNGGQKRK